MESTFLQGVLLVWNYLTGEPPALAKEGISTPWQVHPVRNLVIAVAKPTDISNGIHHSVFDIRYFSSNGFLVPVYLQQTTDNKQRTSKKKSGDPRG